MLEEKGKTNNKAKSFEDLLVWRKSHDFVLEIYKFTKEFPKEELFGLVPQMRRAAVSIPANIAEGFRRAGKQDKLRFFNIAEGSIEEVKYYLILAEDLEYAETKELRKALSEISRLLWGYMNSIRAGMEK
ncbi:MAG: four helix bundle protein [Deltaproteobacteria bacterium]|nr:four helix bundle protein [Deltaproteobacteria bacterium]MBW1929181.1 four helix bundle protein [Deltaproteobacteria bacterium]MBW2127158.1 four helix bundle protein [Deltaproteobacteria bacterium]